MRVGSRQEERRSKALPAQAKVLSKKRAEVLELLVKRGSVCVVCVVHGGVKLSSGRASRKEKRQPNRVAAGDCFASS